MTRRTEANSFPQPEEPIKETLQPKQVRNYALAAQVYLRIHDHDNAAQLYKDAGKPELAEDMKIDAQISPPQTADVDPKTYQNIEGLMRKIARWLTVQQDWKNPAQYNFLSDQDSEAFKKNKQNRITQRDIATLGEESFRLEQEPEYQALLEAGVSDTKLSKILNVPSVEANKARRFGAPSYVLELAEYGDSVLMYHSGFVGIGKKDKESDNPDPKF